MNSKLKSFNKITSKHFFIEVLLPVYFMGIFVVLVYIPTKTLGDFIASYLLYFVIVTIGTTWGYSEGVSEGYVKRLEEETKDKYEK